jgi:hypothetical protein
VTVTFSGAGIQTELSPAPGSIAFGAKDIDDGAAAVQESTVTNSGTEAVSFTGVTLGGSGAAHFERLTGEVGDCTDSTVLTAGQTCKLRARFDPTNVGAKSATITVASNVPDLTVSLSGTGIQTELSRAPAALSFGSRHVNDGPTAAQQSTLTNSGTEPVTLTGVTLGGADAAHFARLTGDPADCADSTTLNAGQTCTLRARFDPSATGAKTATLIVASSVADLAIALTGTGTVPDSAPPPPSDSDSDGRPDPEDNCPHVSNPDQRNTDVGTAQADGLGDACDPDDDGDGHPDADDNCPVVYNAGLADADRDGIGTACDDSELLPGRYANVSNGTSAEETIGGTVASDMLRGFGGVDRLFGGPGDDYLDGGSGGDRLFGGDGDDTLAGREGDDRLYGEGGDDFLSGGDDDDALKGGPGTNRYYGRAGDDRLYADNGVRERVDCGPGADRAIVDRYDRTVSCERVTVVGRR